MWAPVAAATRLEARWLYREQWPLSLWIVVSQARGKAMLG